MNWIRKTEPRSVFMTLAAFECPKCKKALLAIDDRTDKYLMAKISNYKFCPYCGKQVIFEEDSYTYSEDD